MPATEPSMRAAWVRTSPSWVTIWCMLPSTSASEVSTCRPARSMRAARSLVRVSLDSSAVLSTMPLVAGSTVSLMLACIWATLTRVRVSSTSAHRANRKTMARLRLTAHSGAGAAAGLSMPACRA